MKLVKYSEPWLAGGRWFDDSFFNNFFAPAARRNTFSPAVDIKESEQAYTLTAELPGVEKNNVSLEVKDGWLTLSGKREHSKEDKSENYHRIERSFGSFSRSFELPENVAEEKIEANFKDGLLTITLNKSAEPKSKSQAIKIN